MLLFYFVLFFLYSYRDGGKSDLFLPLSRLGPLALNVVPALRKLPFCVTHSRNVCSSLKLSLAVLPFGSTGSHSTIFRAKRVSNVMASCPDTVALRTVRRARLNFVFGGSNCLYFVISGRDHVGRPRRLVRGGVTMSHGAIIRCTASRLLGGTKVGCTRAGGPRVDRLPLHLRVLRCGRVSTSFLPSPTTSVTVGDGGGSLVDARRLKVRFVTATFSQGTLRRGQGRVRLLVAKCGLKMGRVGVRPRSR